MKIEQLRKKLKQKYRIDPFNRKKSNVKEINNEYHDKLKIIGITGSKGKSSVAYLLHNYLKKIGYKSVLYSSIEIDSPLSYYKQCSAIENPLKSRKQLLNAIEQSIAIDADFLILEVNERAIKNEIIKDVPFDIRVLTNIIDKHNDIFYPDYVELKKSFLTEASKNDVLILGIADRSCKQINEELKGYNKRIYCTEYISKIYEIDKKDVDCLITHNNNQFDSINGIDFKVIQKNKEPLILKSNLLMKHNTFNLACVVLILEELQLFDKNKYLEFVKNINIPGRDEVIKFKDRLIIVSPSVIPHLENLKNYQNRGEINQIRVVVGTSGFGFATWIQEFNQEVYEKEKQESMSFAYKYICNNADKIYITTSDLGASNADELLRTQKGLVNNDSLCVIIKNRKDAIKQALKDSMPKDVIFVAGRGNREIMCASKDKIELFKDTTIIKTIIKELMEEQ